MTNPPTVGEPSYALYAAERSAILEVCARVVVSARVRAEHCSMPEGHPPARWVSNLRTDSLPARPPSRFRTYLNAFPYCSPCADALAF